MKIKFFELAKKVAALSDHPDHQMGCVIVRRDKVISLGCNSLKTSPKSTTFHRRIHAELAAILKARCSLEGCSLYVYRATKAGILACAKPCTSCASIIAATGIKRVYYTDNNGYREC